MEHTEYLDQSSQINSAVTIVQNDRWVNIEDVAEYLSISLDTARTWIKKGKLPAYKVGKRYKLKLSEIDEWVRNGRITE